MNFKFIYDIMPRKKYYINLLRSLIFILILEESKCKQSRKYC